MTGVSSGSQLDLPRRVDLPYFAYGLLQPGELAHRQLDGLLTAVRRAEVNGTLRVRDGIPLLAAAGSETIHGWVLEFRSVAGYRAVVHFEPAKLYRWEEITTVDGVTANTLMGATETGSHLLHDDHWTGSEDPVFVHGLGVVREVVDGPEGRVPFESLPPEALDWVRFFRVQMAYLLLWSAVERYLALAYGPDLDPAKKLNALGRDEAFARALSDTVTQPRRVYESRSRESAGLDPAKPSRSAEYFYVVRSNLSHRGKGAWSEAELVRMALHDLFEIFRTMLSNASQAGARDDASRWPRWSA